MVDMENYSFVCFKMFTQLCAGKPRNRLATSIHFEVLRNSVLTSSMPPRKVILGCVPEHPGGGGQGPQGAQPVHLVLDIETRE